MQAELRKQAALGTDGLVIGNLTTTVTGSAKWLGGVLTPKGKIVSMPFEQSDILLIDPFTNETSFLSTGLSGSGKWEGGVLAPNGKVYGIPRNANKILVIDLEANKTRNNFV